MPQQITLVNDVEKEWIASLLEQAQKQIAEYSPSDVGRPFDSMILERVYSAFTRAFARSKESDSPTINAFINSIGAVYGSLLIERFAFQWVVV